MLLSPSSNNISKAAELLRSGQVVSFPTETVYGLGAHAGLDRAVAKIFSLKGRPSNNPLILHFAKFSDILAHFPSIRTSGSAFRRLESLAQFWPGPLTVILPVESTYANLARAGLSSVGVRIPAHSVALSLLSEVSFPLAAPSANPSNYVSPTEASHVADFFGAQAPVIIDGGPCSLGIESTIVSLLGNQAEILRPGIITVEQLEDKLGEFVRRREI